jgi:hypothetical protein
MEFKKQKLTQEKLKELLDYNPETGVFTWRVRRKSVKQWSVAGSHNATTGYISITIDGKSYGASRLAFLWMEDYLPENDVDHIDRNPSNNKWYNLREVSRQCNLRNRGMREDNKSGVTGVYWAKAKGKWRSQINLYGKIIYLGLFKNFLDAVKARWDAEVKHGFPNCNTNSSAFQYLNENLKKP